MNEHFQFARTRQSALHAITHRGKFTADRLREHHHLFGGEAFGIGQANGDFAHGAGGVAHLLHTAQEGSGQEEECRGTKGCEEVKRNLSA